MKAAFLALACVLFVGQAATAATPQSPAQWRKAVSQALADASTTAETAKREAATRELLRLHDALKTDTSLPPSVRDELLLRLRTRLARASKALQSQIAADKAAEARRPANVAAPVPALAQQRGAFVPGGAVNAAANQPTDYGQQLVELIEATIAPSTWESNGGTGVIRYWSGGRALVVRGTTETQENLQDLLGGLRRN